jgi:hypothetical protein
MSADQLSPVYVAPDPARIVTLPSSRVGVTNGLLLRCSVF